MLRLRDFHISIFFINPRCFCLDCALVYEVLSNTGYCMTKRAAQCCFHLFGNFFQTWKKVYVCVFVVCGVLTLPGLGRGECHPQRSTGATAARRIAIWLQKLLRINFSLKWNFSNKNFWPISWPCFLRGLRRMSSARTMRWWISPPPLRKKYFPLEFCLSVKKIIFLPQNEAQIIFKNDVHVIMMS